MININQEIEKIFRFREDAHKTSVSNDLLCCPFCSEKDFDLIGLKLHLTHGDCEPFESIDCTDIKRLF